MLVCARRDSRRRGSATGADRAGSASIGACSRRHHRLRSCSRRERGARAPRPARGRGHALEAQRLEQLERRLPAEPPRLGEKGRREHDPVTRARAGRAPRRPRARRSPARATSAHARAVRSSARLARTDAPSATLSSSRLAGDELDDPAQDQIVGVDVLDRVLELAHLVERDDGTQPRRAGARSRCPRTICISWSIVGIAERRSSGRSGRAAPRAAGTCPPARSGSRSRAAGRGRAAACVTPSTVTWRSAIASSSADCVFGIARLISSTSSTLANTGPGRNSNVARLLVEDRQARDVGRLEVGRALDARPASAPSIEPAIERASTVFAVPGTSSNRTWPRQASAARTSLISLVSCRG